MTRSWFDCSQARAHHERSTLNCKTSSQAGISARELHRSISFVATHRALAELMGDGFEARREMHGRRGNRGVYLVRRGERRTDYAMAVLR